MDSPKTPVRPVIDDSLETDEMESPQFPHLIPVYRRTSNEYDLEGVRIGWDDGYGSVCYQDDDYSSERSFKKRKNSKLFSEHSPVFGPQKFNNNTSQNISSPSPRRCSSRNNTLIQTELNDYLECILKCLSNKKKNRQLMKSKNDSNPTNSADNNLNSLLNDSSNELMILCSQAIEKNIADTNINSINTTKDNYFSIIGISPLKYTNNSINNNLCQHTTEKFIHVKDESNENVQLQCDINNSSDDLATDDYLFSTIDLTEIEQQISSSIDKTISVSPTKKCNKVENKVAIHKNSVFRKTLSSSSINKQLNFQDDELLSTADYKTTGTKYCTASEIASKRLRAQRTRMLKFKSKNKSS